MPAQAGGSDGHPLAVALRLLRGDAPGEISRDPRSWPRWAVLLPHVLAATAYLDREEAPAGQLQEASWLLDRPGAYLRVRGRLNDAQPLLERVLAIAEAIHGLDHAIVATALNNLALTLSDLGHPDQAQPLLERALAIDEAAYGPDHRDVATDLINLATARRALGHPDQAQPLLERALAIYEAAYGPDHPYIAIALNNLAETLRALGRPEQAQTALERGRTASRAAGPG
jgi:tetratricopeptide (TPR) repeat protein